MATLHSVNVFARDFDALSRFYCSVFCFTDIPASRTHIYAAIDTGQSVIGFNALDAYGLLNLGEHAGSTGVRFMLTVDVDSAAELDALLPVAVSHGATVVKPPYTTYYNCYQTVLMDPEGNVFRINYPLP